MKVITAMGDEFLNNKLKNIKNYEVVGKDISYIEGILEFLDTRKDIDCVILSNKIYGEITFEELLEKLVRFKNINIIVFLKEQNEYLENFLNSKKIFKIYYLNENGYELFFDNQQNKLENEIEEIKRLIISKRNYNRKLKLRRFKNLKLYGKILNKCEITNKINFCKTIIISGVCGSGKSIISKILKDFIKKKNKKVFLLDFNNTKFNNYEINNEYEIKKYIESLKEKYEYLIIDLTEELKQIKTVLYSGDKIIFLIEPNLSEINKAKNILDVYINDFEVNVDKIKILFNKTNKYKIAESILEEIFEDFEIIGEIKYDEKYNLMINKNKVENYSDTEYEKIYQAI